MRKAFVESLCELAARDERVMLLTADLGWSVLEPFAERFPSRFLNVGVAEQNMLGIATGLARQGLVPFAYSIATFASMRCYEQFRNGPVLHSLPVRVVGTGGGFAYGHAGPTHHAIEDLAISRALPGVSVVAPADGAQTRAFVEASARLPGPAYLRIDKAELPDIAELGGRFEFDRPVLVRPGRDLLILSAGAIVREALEAAEHLTSDAISPGVAVMAHLPFQPTPELVAVLLQFPEIVTLEEASVVGGLGSLVAETIADFGLPCRLLRLGGRTPLQEHHGDRPYLLCQHRLNSVSVASQAANFSSRRWAA
jgi:transketolase